MLSVSEKAYIAGFFDGEGCFQIIRQRRKDRSSPTYQAIVTVSHTNYEVLEWLKEKYGGKIGYYPCSRGLGVIPVYRWALTGKKNTQPFVKDIQPFLRLKKDEVKIFQKFLDIVDEEWRKKRDRRGYVLPVPAEIISQREKLYWQLKQYHGKRARKSK